MLFSRIRNGMSDFSKNHRLLAQFILDNPNDVAFMTAAQLAREVRVSESTVFRFATQLGFEGYPDLRSVLQEEMMESFTVTDREQAYTSTNEEDDLLLKGFRIDAQAILEAASKINRADLYEVADMIVHAESVYVAGERSSNALAHYLCFYLSWLLPHVHHLNPDYALEKMINLSPRSLVIGITFHRCIRNVVDTLALASRLGLPTVAITNSESSPLAKKASKVLPAPCNYISFIDSYAGPISMINALILAVSRRKFGDTGKSFAGLEALWKERGTYIMDSHREG
jgi:DNA-binding MurR/RpiR family transcriptional regulator